MWLRGDRDPGLVGGVRIVCQQWNLWGCGASLSLVGCGVTGKRRRSRGSWLTRGRSALYEHWERHQWSPFEIDFSVDAASFASLDETTRAGSSGCSRTASTPRSTLRPCWRRSYLRLLTTIFGWFCRHRSPTSIGISSRCCVSSEVFGVRGGIEAVEPLADRGSTRSRPRSTTRSTVSCARSREPRRGHLPEGGRRLSPPRRGVDRTRQPDVRRRAVRSGRFLSRSAGGATARGARRGAPHRHRRLVCTPPPRPRRPSGARADQRARRRLPRSARVCSRKPPRSWRLTSFRPTAPTRRRSGPRYNASSSSACARSG